MYVSEKAKEDLRKYAGQAVQLDAKEVFQPINPGDGRIDKFEYLGAPPNEQSWASLEGISLKSSVKVSESGQAVATITIQNHGTNSVKLLSRELALTLLTECSASKHPLMPPDGPSIALITRHGGVDPRWEGKGRMYGKSYYLSIGKENALPHDVILAPEGKKQIDVQLNLPDGQYDFLCGYGGSHGSKCIASNLSAFDVNEGKAKAVKIKNR